MRHFHIKTGQRVSVGRAAPSAISKTIAPGSVALLGRDLRGMQPRLEVAQGDHVAQGQVVFRDRKHPQIAYVSPICGRVQQLSYGPRKTLSSLIICADDTVSLGPVTTQPSGQQAATIREALQARGLWPAFRTRPFGRTPEPDAVPSAILVNATHSAPDAPDPRLVLAEQRGTFERGTALLSHLTSGQVFICQNPGGALGPSTTGVEHVSFSGTMAAGLVGTHIDRLRVLRAGNQIWSVGYQDVAAIGQLYETGLYGANRVVSVAGPASPSRQLVSTCLGARLTDICDTGSSRVLSGDALSGYDAAFLGRFHEQLTLLPKTSAPSRRRWTSRHPNSHSALIPTRGLDKALGVNVLPVPLMRALSIGDAEQAQRLGCLGLVEEDVALLSRRCTSGADYGVLLRQVLDELMMNAP